MRLLALSFVIALAAGAAQAAGSDCTQAKRPVDQLICRDDALQAAQARLDEAVKELEGVLDDARRERLAAAQRDWTRRRDETCPVIAADLAGAAKGRVRVECLSHVIDQRVLQLRADLKGERDGVRPLPLTITDAEPPKFPPPRTGTAMPYRPVQVSALGGRWAKADPLTRRPIDDCRTAYLEIGRDGRFVLLDPRTGTPPVESRITFAGTDPVAGLAFSGDTAPARGSLRLEPSDTARFDRVVLNLEQPFAFGATFVRCR